MQKRFWLVCNPDRLGIHPPTCKHESCGSARREAERLARENPGQQFHVMESVCAVVKDDVRWTVFPDAVCSERSEVEW